MCVSVGLSESLLPILVALVHHTLFGHSLPGQWPLAVTE